MSGYHSSAEESAASSKSHRVLKRKRTGESGALNGLAGSPTGSAAKRILTRSLTEPVLDDDGSPVSSKSRSADALLETPSSTPRHRRNNGTPTRTYASKSRSFLVALPVSKLGALGLSDADANLLDDEPTGDEVQASYTDLRTRWGVDISETDSLDPSPCPSPSKRRTMLSAPPPEDELPALDLVTDLKTITELRDKGESRRFHDEVGYLFEGMDPKSNIGVRRAGALEIVTKLCDPEFARKAKASDVLGRAWDVLRRAGAGDGDQFLDVALAFFAVLVAREDFSTSLAHHSDFVPTLLKMVSSVTPSNDLLSIISSTAGNVRIKKIKKTEQVQFKALLDVVLRSGAFPEEATISSRLVICQALVSLPITLLRHWDVSFLHSILLSELSPLPRILNDHLAGRTLSRPSSSDIDIPSFGVIGCLLRLLDSVLLGSVPFPESGDDSDNLAKRLTSLCVVTEVLVADRSMSGWKIVGGCLEYALRVLVGLTHQSRDWNKKILHQEYFLTFLMRTIMRSHREYLGSILQGQSSDHAPTSEEENRALDCFCLALGICTNLVQNSDEARDIYQAIRMDCECRGSPECIRTCCCDNRSSVLHCLTFVYAQLQGAGDHGDATLDFLRGHLAVLFGLLMQNNPVNQEELLKSLPGSSDSAKLHTLLGQAREFLAVYADFRSRLFAAAGWCVSEEDVLFMSVVRHVDHITEDRKAEKVAHDVIILLAALCETMKNIETGL